MDKIEYHLRSPEELASACIPFIKGGGLFVRTATQYPLGTLLNISLKLVDAVDPLIFTAKVVWITPKHEQNQMPEGVGIQFAEEHATEARKAIEAIVADAFSIGRKTNTFLK